MKKNKMLTVLLVGILVTIILFNNYKERETKEVFLENMVRYIESTYDLADVVLDYNAQNESEEAIKSATVELSFRLNRIYDFLDHTKLYTNKVDTPQINTFAIISSEVREFLTDDVISEEELIIINKLSDDMKTLKSKMVLDEEVINNNLTFKDINRLLIDFSFNWDIR